MKSKRGPLYLYGIHPVLEALNSEACSITKLFLCKGKQNKALSDIFRRAKTRGIEIAEIDRKELEKKVGIVYHQGVVGIISDYRYFPVEKLIHEAFQKSSAPVIAILDGVTDPGNLGGVIRSAEALGVAGIIIPKNRSSSISPAVFKRSAGAAYHVPVSRVTNLSQTIEFLKKNKFWVIGADAMAQSSIWDGNMEGPLSVVFGSESRGLSRLTSKLCDFVLSIPMGGMTKSLNIASSAAIIFYEIKRQRNFSRE